MSSMSLRSCSFDLESEEPNAAVLNRVVVKVSTEHCKVIIREFKG